MSLVFGSSGSPVGGLATRVLKQLVVHDLQHFLRGAQDPSQADLAAHILKVPAHPRSLRADLPSAEGFSRRIIPRMQAERSGSADNENHAFSL